MIATLGFSQTVVKFGIETKKTWHGRRYAIVKTSVQQERKGLRWVDVHSEETTFTPMYPFTPEGHARCKERLVRLQKQEREERKNASQGN